jgi:phage shock protein A
VPSILRRLRVIIITNVHDIIDRVEDPQRALKLIIREIEDNILQIQEGVIDAFVGEKRLQEELAEHKRQSQLWLQRAEQSIRLGRRDLARKAVERKTEHHSAIQALEPSWRMASQTAGSLKSKLLSLQKRLAEAKQTQCVWEARRRAAEAQQTLERTFAKVQNLNAFAKALPAEYSYSHAIERVKIMEAKANAIAQTLNSKDQIEDDFLALEMERAIDSELAEIELKIQRELLERFELTAAKQFQESSFGNHSVKNP